MAYLAAEDDKAFIIIHVPGENQQLTGSSGLPANRFLLEMQNYTHTNNYSF